MTHISKTIVFFGTDEFSAASLRALISEGYSIGAVVTKPDSRKGRGRELSKSVVKEIAEVHDIPVLQPLKLGDIAEDITALASKTGVAPLGVLVSYGKIIPQSIIDLFQPGIINVHPSLLPLYRGPSPIESAILHGDVQTGVTIMQLSAAMDAGPIYSQVNVPLQGTETAPELEKAMADRGAEELCRVLPEIISGDLTPTPQDDERATYCQLLSKDNSILNPETITAAQADCQVRAYLSFPKTKVTIAGHLVIITKAHIRDDNRVADGTLSPLDIKFSDGKYLSVDELIGPSGKAMNAKAFLNGYLGKA